MDYTVLSSGSRQNAHLLRDGETLILVDCGMSFKRLKTLMDEVGVKPDDLSAVMITHDHLDHVRGLATLVKKLAKVGIPVFAHPKIHHRLKGHPYLHLFPILPTKEIQVDNITVSSRILPHDATLNQGFCFTSEGHSLVLLTDLGHFPQELKSWARNPDLLAVEANYDVQMLKDSVYPEKLKKRVRGSYGHLSNSDSLELVKDLVGTKTTKVCLLHLSENNNRAELVQQLFETEGKCFFPSVEVLVAKRREALPWMSV